jgi:hypothetical protein
MTPSVFSAALETLCDYYERKHPRRETVELWHGKVRGIKDEAINTILSHIQENHDGFPKNLPMLMLALYRDWAAGNPGGSKKEVMCPDCNGGIVTLTKVAKTTGCRCKYAFVCARCKQYQAVGYRTAFLEQLLSEGWEEAEREGRSVENRNIGRLVQGIIKNVPPVSSGQT